jgi:hypothetical protein
MAAAFLPEAIPTPMPHCVKPRHESVFCYPFCRLVRVSKGLQAIGDTTVDYAKKSFEDGTRAFEQLVGAKSYEQVWEIQSQYAKKAFDSYVAQASKLGEMYVDVEGFFIWNGTGASPSPNRREPGGREARWTQTRVTL